MILKAKIRFTHYELKNTQDWYHPWESGESEGLLHSVERANGPVSTLVWPSGPQLRCTSLTLYANTAQPAFHKGHWGYLWCSTLLRSWRQEECEFKPRQVEATATKLDDQFDSWDPHAGKRTDSCKLSYHLCIHAVVSVCAYMYIHVHTNKCNFKFLRCMHIHIQYKKCLKNNSIIVMFAVKTANTETALHLF